MPKKLLRMLGPTRNYKAVQWFMDVFIIGHNNQNDNTKDSTYLEQKSKNIMGNHICEILRENP